MTYIKHLAVSLSYQLKILYTSFENSIIISFSLWILSQLIHKKLRQVVEANHLTIYLLAFVFSRNNNNNNCAVSIFKDTKILVCRVDQGFPNFSARDPQNNGARD